MARDPHIPPQDDPADRDPADRDAADDPVELWGRRIGRALAVLAAIVLAVYFVVTYLP